MSEKADATAALILECRDALAEELAGWDLDPPLHHVQQAHDKCVAWLAAPPAQPAEPQQEWPGEPVRSSDYSCGRCGCKDMVRDDPPAQPAEQDGDIMPLVDTLVALGREADAAGAFEPAPAEYNRGWRDGFFAAGIVREEQPADSANTPYDEGPFTLAAQPAPVVLSDELIKQIGQTLGEWIPGLCNYDSWPGMCYEQDANGEYSVPGFPPIALRFARAVLAAAVPAGWQLVPVEPTVEMRRAAAPWIANYHMMRATDKTNAITDAYRAMLAAAPRATT